MSQHENDSPKSKDAKRQHVRIHVPASIRIESKEYQIVDLSVGGARIAPGGSVFKEGQTYKADLLFKFEDFHLSLDVSIAIEHFKDAEQDVGVGFRDLTVNQTAILTNILKNYMAGDFVATSDVLNVVVHENTARAVQAQAEIERQNKPKWPYAFCAAGGLLLGYILGSFL